MTIKNINFNNKIKNKSNTSRICTCICILYKKNKNKKTNNKSLVIPIVFNLLFKCSVWWGILKYCLEISNT